MADYVLSCCSTADLSAEHFEKRDIHYICFHYEMDGKWYADDLGKRMSFSEFYGKMNAGSDTKTSQVSVGEYVDYFTPILNQGKDIIHVTLSSGISGTLNSAKTAADSLKGEFPDRKITIIDSFGASSGYGLLMDLAADRRDEGMEEDDLIQWIEEERYRINHWFFSTDLHWYVKGGRISKAAGAVGGLLHICPLLNMDEEGKLIPREKIRGEAVVIKKIVERMEQYADQGLAYADKCYISMSNCPELAEPVSRLIKEKFKNLKGDVEINSVGTTIGAHTGPGTVALFFVGRDRREPLL